MEVAVKGQMAHVVAWVSRGGLGCRGIGESGGVEGSSDLGWELRGGVDVGNAYLLQREAQGFAEVCSLKMRVVEARPVEGGVPEVCSLQVSSKQTRVVQVGSDKDRTLEMSIPEVRPLEVSAAEVCLAEICLAQVEVEGFAFLVLPVVAGTASEDGENGLDIDERIIW